MRHLTNQVWNSGVDVERLAAATGGEGGKRADRPDGHYSAVCVCVIAKPERFWASFFQWEKYNVWREWQKTEISDCHAQCVTLESPATKPHSGKSTPGRYAAYEKIWGFSVKKCVFSTLFQLLSQIGRPVPIGQSPPLGHPRCWSPVHTCKSTYKAPQKK